MAILLGYIIHEHGLWSYNIIYIYGSLNFTGTLLFTLYYIIDTSIINL